MGLRGCNPPIAIRKAEDELDRVGMIAWAIERIPNITRLEPGLCFPLEVRRDGKRVAVAIYHEWRGNVIELSMAADTPRWATRSAVASILSWPFTTLGVRRITTITPEQNNRALRLNQGLGFTREGRMRDVFDDGAAAIIMGFTRADWLASRWCRSEGMS